MADPDFELSRGPGFILLAQPAFLPSVISSFFTQTKGGEGGGGGRLPFRILSNYSTLLYSWRFSRYSAPTHWLIHGHKTSNNETVSRQMP